MRDNEVDLAPWLDDDRLPRIIGLQAALARGLSYDAIERRVHAGRWHRVLPRTYLTRDTFTDLDRTIAALTFAGRGAALSGAAALWSAGVKRVALPRELLLIVPPENCTASTRWVRVRRSVRPLIYQLAPGPRCVDLEVSGVRDLGAFRAGPRNRPRSRRVGARAGGRTAVARPGHAAGVTTWWTAPAFRA